MTYEALYAVGVVVEDLGAPRGGGGPGSALYSVPIRLSRPLSQWEAELLLNLWDHPPQFTTMHRRGIARVSGDLLVLDGITIDEVDSYHAATIAGVLIPFNEV